MSNKYGRYLLITPAKNEEAFIELTIKSVVAQTVRPDKWLIVSDGSTDETDGIIARYAKEHDWIELLRMGERRSRDFGGKATCVNVAYARIRHLPHNFVASLDADITFPDDHFAFLLQKFAEEPQLGLAGAPFSEGGDTYNYYFSSTDHVSGACQMFRRECFEQIGGYTPVKGGGIDVVAVLSARSRGWLTRTFTERTVSHHRPMGSSNNRNRIGGSFRFGQKSYRLGYHPLWQVCRALYQMTRKPYVIGALADSVGYFWAMVRRIERPIGAELIQFQQRDQMRRLRRFFKKLLFRQSSSRQIDPVQSQPVNRHSQGC